MNVGDSEIVVSIMQNEGLRLHRRSPGGGRHPDQYLLDPPDNAEQRIWGRLAELRGLRRRRQGVLIGIIGCMAERLKERLTEGEDAVDIVAGPDAYRDLPKLVREAGAGGKGINVLLSREETYAEIAPVRLDRNGVSAFVAIMRGCNNYCSYCVVPYTRGIERSRDPETILAEVRSLFANGYREVTLLGQNVNSYRAGEVGFPELIRRVADVSPLLRVRFATSHPKDMSDALLEAMASRPNICRAIHLPAQSGSTGMLRRMNRKYTREWYLDRVAAIRRYLPDCAVTTDLIAGFSGETEEEHAATLSLMREVGYEFAYMFKYSERPGTFAHEAPARRRARRGEDAPAVGDHRPAKRTGGRRANLPRRGARVRGAGRGALQARATRSSRAARRRTRSWSSTAAGHGVGDYVRVRITGCTAGHAVRRRDHLRIYQTET